MPSAIAVRNGEFETELVLLCLLLMSTPDVKINIQYTFIKCFFGVFIMVFDFADSIIILFLTKKSRTLRRALFNPPRKDEIQKPLHVVDYVHITAQSQVFISNLQGLLPKVLSGDCQV